MVTLGSPVVGKKPDETTQKPEIAINLVVVVGAIIGATLGIAGFAALVTAGLRKRRMVRNRCLFLH